MTAAIKAQVANLSNRCNEFSANFQTKFNRYVVWTATSTFNRVGHLSLNDADSAVRKTAKVFATFVASILLFPLAVAVNAYNCLKARCCAKPALKLETPDTTIISDQDNTNINVSNNNTSVNVQKNQLGMVASVNDNLTNKNKTLKTALAGVKQAAESNNSSNNVNVNVNNDDDGVHIEVESK